MPVRGSRVVVADTGTESKGSTGTQEVVLQGVCERQDRWELWGLQEALGLGTMEVLQTGRQEDQGRWEAWVHVKENHLGPEVGVDKVVDGQNCCCCLRRRPQGLRQVVRDWVVEEPLQEEVRSWEDFCTMGGAVMDHNYDT